MSEETDYLFIPILTNSTAAADSVSAGFIYFVLSNKLYGSVSQNSTSSFKWGIKSNNEDYYDLFSLLSVVLSQEEKNKIKLISALKLSKIPPLYKEDKDLNITIHNCRSLENSSSNLKLKPFSSIGCMVPFTESVYRIYTTNKEYKKHVGFLV